MDPNTASPKLSRRVSLIFAIALAVGAAVLVMSRPDSTGAGDQSRYATLGLNLLQHGVFSAEHYDPAGPAPVPTLAAGGPIIAGEIALSALIDRRTREGLECMVATKATSADPCELWLPALRALHVVEILIFFAGLFVVSRGVLADDRLAWVATCSGLACREVFDGAALVLTEPLYAMTWALFAAASIETWRRGFDPRFSALTGALLGAGILVKPTLAVLVVVVPISLSIAGLLARCRLRRIIAANAALLAMSLMVILPWLVRSTVLSGAPAMTDAGYLEASLAHRFGYQSMTATEWLIGWLYFLPDFGDKLAALLFEPSAFVRLGWGDSGFYHYGSQELHAQARALTAPDPATRYLLTTYVLGDPLRFIAVTGLLLWRGLFIGTYWGLVGLLALPFVLLAGSARLRTGLFVVGAPAVALAVVHAAVSVSIPRYNIALATVYAPVVAYGLGRVASAVLAALKTKRRQAE